MNLITFHKFAVLSFVCGMAVVLCSSCFTGVEGTKKITMSGDDRKRAVVSAEEDFFSAVTGVPLSEWDYGKVFIASDNKALLVFEQEGLPRDVDSVALGGQLLSYGGTGLKLAPDGKETLTIVFKNKSGQRFVYNTGLSREEGVVSTKSDQIPMLIDMDMVGNASAMLEGRTLWIKSPLWYDSAGVRKNGRKFDPVTVMSVKAGILAFPMQVEFKDTAGSLSYAFMSFGHSPNDSRSFANLFSLSDPRNRFKSVTDENWKSICNGTVRTGMTKEEVKLALGNPSEVEAGRSYSQTIDIWQYPDGGVLWFADGILTRYKM